MHSPSSSSPSASPNFAPRLSSPTSESPRISPLSSPSAPNAPPLSPALLRSPVATSSGISEIKSESALVKRQRMAAEALKQLQAMPIHLGFSFDAVEENDNPFLGLLVDAIEPNSPAALSGLSSGDVVLEVNGTRALTLTDLLESIKGLVPGTPIQFIVERAEEEVELIVTLGGKGQNQGEVLRLYSLVQSVQNGTDELVRTGALSLSDVLETPQFRFVLQKFMESNLCAESIEFLQVEQAFQRLSEGRRDYAAHIIAQEFIYEHGEKMVNIDADTRKEVITRLYENGENSPLIFHEAAKAVYKMCENDVFRRFVTAGDYQRMVENPQDTEALAMRAKRRRLPSWAIIPLEDSPQDLEEISLSFAKTPVVQDRRHHLKRYKACFKGAELVHWLCEAGYAKNRPAAIAIGQRLWDGFYLRAATEESSEFEDGEKLFTFTPAQSGEPISVADLITKSGGSNSPQIFCSALLLKGVRYSRLHAVVQKEKKKLYLFRSPIGNAQLAKIRLKGANFFLVQGPPALVAGGDEQRIALAKLSLTPALKRPNGVSRELLTYLTLENPGRNLTFRFESQGEAEIFIQNITKCGAVESIKEIPS